MTEDMVLRLSENWSLKCDPNQWIVCKLRMANGQQIWRPVSFVGSTKSVLRRVFREKSVSVSPEAERLIGEWPERFLDWRSVWETRTQDEKPIGGHEMQNALVTEGSASMAGDHFDHNPDCSVTSLKTDMSFISGAVCYDDAFI